MLETLKEQFTQKCNSVIIYLLLLLIYYIIEVAHVFCTV